MTSKMTFSSAIVACFLFSVCFSHSSASVIPNEKVVDHVIGSKAYYLHVTERATKFTETIIIDEDKHLEYFHVPAHNQVTEAVDYLYDFKNNMAVERIDGKGVCYLGPLPEKSLNPRNLKAVLDKMSHAPPSDDEIIYQNYWIISEQVDKNLLREEVQKFCQDFPIYRRQKVELNSTNSHSSEERTRLARNSQKLQPTSRIPPFCKQEFPTECNPGDWLFDYKIRTAACTYWLTCNFDINDNTLDCETLKTWTHVYNSVLCYIPRCP